MMRIPLCSLLLLGASLQTACGAESAPSTLKLRGSRSMIYLREQAIDDSRHTQIKELERLKGGGIPAVLITAAATAVAFKTNEGLRSRVMKALANVHLGPLRIKPTRKFKPMKVAEVAEESQKPVTQGYDVRNGTWACETDTLEQGCLLVSSPDTFRLSGSRQAEQILDQTVVLLLRHGRTGSSGFIINRPTQYTVGFFTKKLPVFEKSPVFLGGEIGENLCMVHSVPGLRNSTEISEGLYYGGVEHAVELVSSGRASAEEFRFFFKNTAWLPGQLEAEINAGCWCPIRGSLNFVLKLREMPGLHLSLHNKVFWHQALHVLGGRFVNISRETHMKEELERIKLEEWTGVLLDGSNQTIQDHAGVELGALALASATFEIGEEDVEAVHDKVKLVSEKADELLQSAGPADGARTPEVILEALSSAFFSIFTAITPQRWEDKESGKALFVDLAASGQVLDAPTAATRAAAWQAARNAADPEAGAASPAEQGGVDGGESDAESKALKGLHHVQLYLSVMHRLANEFARRQDEAMVMTWLRQIRVLQSAVATIAYAENDAAEGGERGRAGAEEGAEDAEEGGPSRPLNVTEVFGAVLRAGGGGGAAVSSACLEGKYVGLYFSASWCAPCKAFTPKLIQTYSKIKIADGRPLEIVLVSSDRTPDAYAAYADVMPWPAVPFADRQRRAALGQQLDVRAIPKLVIIDPAGRVVSTEGHRLVLQDPLGDRFPWIEDAAAAQEEADEEEADAAAAAATAAERGEV